MPHPHRLLLAAAAAGLVLLHLSLLVSGQSTLAECGQNLLQLAPCAPFVQGMAAVPVQSCCTGLAQFHNQKPACICLLLNDNSLAASFPVNTSLALQLPVLCNLQIDPSSCPGILFSERTENCFDLFPVILASPVVTMSPRPSSMVLGRHQSSEVKLKSESQLSMLLLTAIFIVLARVAEI